MAKTSVPISILCGLLFNCLNQSHLFTHRKAVMLLLILATAAASVFLVRSLYPLVSDFSIPEKQAAYIRHHAKPEEAVFISRDTTNAFFADFFLTYLSERNLRYAEGEDDAARIACELKKKKGVFFELNPDTTLCVVKRFDIHELK